jgi:hypothetical protein
MDSPSNLFVLVNFKIVAETEFGDSVSLTGNIPELGTDCHLFLAVLTHMQMN